MLIGVPKEIKNNEFRVGLTPSSAMELISNGHEVYIETNAGLGIGFSDSDYEKIGAKILPSASDVFAKSEMIIKVKEPQAVERKMLREDQILFTYLHLAPDESQTLDLVASKAICIAYETVTDNNNALPLLAPMSAVAGRMSIQAGAQALEKSKQGCGLLLGGVPGVAPANVTIIGGGVVGINSAKMALGLGANVTILDKNIDVLNRLDEIFEGNVTTLYSTKNAIEESVINADLVVGAVLIPGASAPKLVSKALISRMKKGSAIVDVAIDQGGCFETSRATTHENPTFVEEGVVHYCVANMPGGVAKTSTFALNNATLPYILKIANLGWKEALLSDQHLLNGLNVVGGKVTIRDVALAHNLDYTPAAQAII